MVMIVWQLDLQLHVQSVYITTLVLISNPAHGEVYSIQQYVIKFFNDLRQVDGFPPPIKLTGNLIGILLNVVVSTIALID